MRGSHDLSDTHIQDLLMPIYEYMCQDCGVVSEKLRRIADRNDPFKCPECGSDNTKLAVSVPSINIPVTDGLRGSGKADMDRVIGKDAEMRQEYYKREGEKKFKVRKESGQAEIGRTNTGEYIPLPKKHLEQRGRAYNRFEHAKKNGVRIDHDG